MGLLKTQLQQTFGAHESHVVLVRGEPGIGKSSLLRSFLEAMPVSSDGCPVLSGYGQSMTTSAVSDAFQAIRECLRSLVSNAERSKSKVAFGRLTHAFRIHAPDWLESVPMIGSLLAVGLKTGMAIRESEGTPEHLNSQMDQLTAFVSELLESGPLVLVLDDLQWADSATIDVLMSLALKTSGPLLLILAYRPDDLDAGQNAEAHPLTKAIFRLRRYRPQLLEIELQRLSSEDTRTLICALDKDGAIDDEGIQDLVEQSAGIPLYAESLAIVRSQSEAPASHGEPTREIAAVIDERLSFASAEDQRLLEVATVIGFVFEVRFLADLARVDIDDLYEQLDGLLRQHHLIVEAEALGDLDRYALCQPMLADVLRGRASTNAPRWRRYHQKLVDLLLDQKRTDELAVRAAAAAVVAMDARAGELALDAAKRLYKAGAVSKARELAELAINSGIGPGASLDAFELLARSLEAEANHQGAADVCERSLNGLEPGAVWDPRVWNLKLIRVRSLRMMNNWFELDDLLSQMEAELPPTADEERAEVLMLRASIALCGPQQDTATCIDLCDRVVELSDKADLTSRALGHRGLAHLAAYQPDEAEVWLHKAIDVVRKDGHPYHEYEALHWLSKKKMACLELDEAWSLLGQLAEISTTSGVASDTPFHRRDTSRVLGLRGEALGAATAFVQFFDLSSDQNQIRAIAVLASQVHELEDLGSRETADRMIDAIVAFGLKASSRPGAHDGLTTGATKLKARCPGWLAVPFAVDVLGVEEDEARAADAIFRFDVGDLARLRRELGAR